MPPTPSDDETSLTDVGKYLALTGWTSERVDGLDVYYLLQDGDLQIVLPTRADGRSVEQIDEAIRVIAYAEGRTTREIRANLTGAGADTIAIRLLADTPAGTAPLAAAQEAITALRDLVVGAASALQNRSLALPARPPADISFYADRTHFSTRPGSFIVDLTLPLTTMVETAPPSARDRADDDDLALIAADEVDATPQRDLNPYGRAVSRRIRQTTTRALGTADQVAQGNLPLGVFTDPGRNLGNATELDAIAKLGGGLATSFQIRFAESALAPGAEPVEVLTASPAQQDILVAAASLIREKQTYENVDLTGYVIRLVKKRQNAQAPGDVTVRTVIEELGENINCWVHLAGADYERALNAHHDGDEVHMRGTLEHVNSRWRLRDVTNFEVPSQPPPATAPSAGNKR